MLECKNISLEYDRDKEFRTIALDKVSLQFPSYGMYGITGTSGSGKSSLLYCLSLLKYPTSGKILFNNVETSSLDEDRRTEVRYRNFGIIFQKDFLIPYIDVISNVLVKQNSYKEKKVAVELLEMLELKKCINKYPNELSGGQRQRVSIARALITNPSIIFADEPTASLDKKSAYVVMKILQEVSKKSLVIFVTHDLDLFSIADKIIRVDEGRIINK